jgi:cellulose synthase/poly-beta-1,6-N-acetylglucosamine synthase-like glycosyltransferase
MTLVLVLSLSALAYTYIGYPVLLRLLVWLRGERTVRQAAITPAVSLVISAYNEAPVMRRKLDNALSLVYPQGDLEIVVISDASDDGTDDIVGQFAARGVTLARQATRRGKTAGLNRIVPGLRGNIIVFSDANALYEPEALRKIVRNFADPQVGCVTGEARYLPSDTTMADAGERAYWSFEIRIKRWESALGSVVGGDGAIYAIRRNLWQPLPDTAISDFLNPLQIVSNGWRAVYEPEAVCFEETAGQLGGEFRRRLRIVSRSWRAVFQAPGALNPKRVGLFAWQLVSHKLMRWLTAVFALSAAVAAVVLMAPIVVQRPRGATATLVTVGLLLMVSRRGRRLLKMAVYGTVISAASFVGIVMGSLGRVSGTWTPPRHPPERAIDTKLR